MLDAGTTGACWGHTADLDSEGASQAPTSLAVPLPPTKLPQGRTLS